MVRDDGSHERETQQRRDRDDDDKRGTTHRRRQSNRDGNGRRRQDISPTSEPRMANRRRTRTPDPSRRRRSTSRDRGRDVYRQREERRHHSSERGTHRRRRSPNDKELAHPRKRRYDDDRPAASDDDHNRMPTRKRSPLRRGGPLPTQADSFAVDKGDLEEPPKPKEQPNFGHSGSLAKDANSVEQADGSTVTLKYHEPPEARKPPPKDDWKLFVFKGNDVVDTISLSVRSCWLIGRELTVVDLAAEHPSLSKQHAVVQFRHVEKRNEFGDRIGRVKPYLIDLESANGTKLNGKKIAVSRYVELRDKDVVKFGHSTREYVVMLAPRD